MSSKPRPAFACTLSHAHATHAAHASTSKTDSTPRSGPPKSKGKPPIPPGQEV